LSIDIYSEKIFLQKLNYIHQNPGKEKWKLTQFPEDYHYSSAGFYETGIDVLGILSHCKG
jgi:putative transposase